jgi:DNA-binding MarR family transcriptional regulator
VSGALAFELHALVARLDRSADRLLRAEMGLSYRRFLALFMVDQLGATTQRALAQRLDVSEPSVSRMTTLLARAGLLDVAPASDGGNRRRLALTSTGKQLVDECRDLLAERLADVVARSGIPADDYLVHTRRLSALLNDGGPDQ